MKLDIETMFIAQPRSRDDSSSTGVRLYGLPIHLTEQELISRYRTKPLNDFLASEARFGIGNYALMDVDSERCRIITSPGYCGGYAHVSERGATAATTLGSLLRAIRHEIAMDSFGLGYFLSYAPKSAYYQYPFTTMFKGVFRLPPATLLEFRNGECTVFRSYILKGKEMPRPASFEAAMDEVTTALARHFSATGKQPALMFSGGVDSLSIYLGLREKMGDGIRAFTVAHNRINGPDRAFAVGESLNLPIEHLEDTFTWSDATNQLIAEMMGEEIVSGRGPNMALLGKNIGGTMILHGQNMDAISKVTMLILNANLNRGYLSREKVREARTDSEKILQYEAFLGNLQFTRAYLADPSFQKESVAFYARMHASTEPDPDPGGRGIFRGMISSQMPNLLYKTDYPVDQLAHLDSEVGTFLDYIGVPDLDSSLGIHLIRYYTYAHLANKRIATLPTSDGSRYLLVAMSGPILTHFIGRPIDLSNASKPKAEIYEFVEKIGGKPYNELTRTSRDPFKLRKLDKFQGDSLLLRNMERIDPDKSLVIPRIEDDLMRSYVEYVYRDVSQTARPDDPEVTFFSQSRGRHMLNLELLIQRAIQ